MLSRRSKPWTTRPQPIDVARHSRESLVAWARHNMPDLRIGYALIEGKRRCFASWTFFGVQYEREADDEMALAREVAIAVARLLRLPVKADRDEAHRLELEMINAARAGNTAAAEQIGRELALRHEGVVPIAVRHRVRV